MENEKVQGEFRELYLGIYDNTIKVFTFSREALPEDVKSWMAKNGCTYIARSEWRFFLPIDIEYIGETINDCQCHHACIRWCPDAGEYCEEVKRMEQRELCERMVKKYRPNEDEGLTHIFVGEKPIIAAYVNDEPRDFVVNEVTVTAHGRITLRGYEKEEGYTEFEKDVDDVFPGQLSYVTNMIK